MLYKDIPPHVRQYIQVSENDFNACPESVQNILYSQAQAQAASHRAVPEQQPIDMSQWTWSGKYYERSFLGLRYRDYMYQGSTTSPLSLTAENVHTFCETMDEIGAKHLPQEENNSWYSYEITLITSHGHINSSLGSLINAIIKNTEKYNDDSLEITKVAIRYTSSNNRITTTRGIHAGNGEGIPVKLSNGFWLLDLFKSKSLCIINCYLLWQWYKSGKITNIHNNYKQFCKERDGIRKAISHKSISIEKIHQKYPHDYSIVFSEADIVKLQPEDTLKKCTYFYSNGHMYLVIHEKHIEDMHYITTKSHQTYIEKIKPKKIPAFSTEINVMDIESYRSPGDDDKFCHIPLMVGHIYKNKYECFKGDNCLADYMARMSSIIDQDTVVWAHNGGRYDFHLLLEDAMKISDGTLENPIEILDIHGKYIQMTVKLPNGLKLYFRDSYSLIPSSLNKIAKDFGIEGKLDEDIVNVTRDELLNHAQYVKYNKQDCKILQNILGIYQSQCIDAFKVDPLNHPSASSYGKRVFYSQYYNAKKTPLYTLPRNVHNFVNRSYGGGRCEVFYRGICHEKLKYYDINSSYPNAGCLPLPYSKPIRHGDLNHVNDIHNFLTRHPGFYEVKVIKCGNGKPIHGVMHEGKYIFPKFNYNSPSIILFSEEIKYGLSLGWDYQLLNGYEFKLNNWGKEFFERMYNEKFKAKKAGNKALEYSYKITANSSYGFFGYDKYNRHVTKIYNKDMLEHVKCLEYNARASFYEYDDKILAYENTNVLLDDVNIAVASAITSYGRIHLHKLIDSIEKNKGSVYYVDTDSLITDLTLEEIPNLQQLVGEKLGQLKSELVSEDVITKAVFVSSKLYGFETQKGKIESHAKGVHKNKEELFKDLETMITQDVTFDVSSMFIGRITKTKGDLNIYDKQVSKVLSGKYSKRIVLDTGQTIDLLYSPADK